MIFNSPHFYRTEVSFDLLDAGLAVYHPNYLILCDRARAAALVDAGYSFNELWADGYSLAVRENRSEYFKPARMGDRLLIETLTTEASGVALQVQQKIYTLELKSDGAEQQTLIHQVHLNLVCIKLNPIRATRMPDRLRAALKLLER